MTTTPSTSTLFKTKEKILKYQSLTAALGIMVVIVTLALPAKAHAQQNKVSVCHITETYDFGSGPIAIGNEISIAEPALDAHIAHGDTQNYALTSLPQGTVVCVPDNGGNPDTDNDGQTDADEIACGSDPFSASNTARDIDGDNQPDCVDPDDDNDGVPDDQDVFPNDPSESDDSDGDGVGDNADQCPGTTGVPDETGCSPDQTGGSGKMVISQVYGGGGNSGAPFACDFIELFNAGDATQSIVGWSVQYANGPGTNWEVTWISGSVPPGGYILVQMACGTNGSPLLAPDVLGSTQVGAISGKIALVNNGTALSGEGLGASGVVDFVGYGSASSCEGFAPGSCTATVSGLTNTLAALRNSAGCIDTDNNASDFSTGSPNPRYAISPANICSP